MALKTVEDIRAFRDAVETRHRQQTGTDKVWGNPEVPPLVEARGAVLFEDDFRTFDAWKHEGIGGLTTPEPGVMQLDCIGSRQGGAGCMAFCTQAFPDDILIEYEMRALTSRGLLITFIGFQARDEGRNPLTDLPSREGIFADYIYNPGVRSYHLSISRYNDRGEHTGVSNWRRNPGIFLMGQQPDLCREPDTWYRIAIVKRGPLLQLAVNGELAGGFVDPAEIPEPIPTGGYIGFRTIGADVRVQIRNFRVRSLE